MWMCKSLLLYMIILVLASVSSAVALDLAPVPSLPASNGATPPSPAAASSPAPSQLPRNTYQRITILVTALFIAVLFFGFSAHYFTLRSCSLRRRHGDDFLQEGWRLELGEDGERGLDPCIVRSLPVVRYSAIREDQEQKELKELAAAGGAAATGEVKGQLISRRLECAVCITDFEEGEEMKTLPVCGHSFHKGCIDMWLHSHTTCPVCRLSLLKDRLQVAMDSLSSPQVLQRGRSGTARSAPRSPVPERDPRFSPHLSPRGQHTAAEPTKQDSTPIDIIHASTSAGGTGGPVNGNGDDVDADGDGEEARNSSAALYPRFPSST